MNLSLYLWVSFVFLLVSVVNNLINWGSRKDEIQIEHQADIDKGDGFIFSNIKIKKNLV